MKKLANNFQTFLSNYYLKFGEFFNKLPPKESLILEFMQLCLYKSFRTLNLDNVFQLPNWLDE